MKRLDGFGTKPYLNIRGSLQYQTYFGAFVTVCMLLIIAVQAGLLSEKLIYHLHPAITSYTIVRDPSKLG